MQTGGPSGGCIPEQFLDMPVDYDSLAKVGSIMGSGGMIVMDETSCMVDVAQVLHGVLHVASSCGKCIPCRVGTARCTTCCARSPTARRRAGRPGAARGTVRHGQEHQPVRPGQTAPNPVLSTLRYFRNEYTSAHSAKRCAAAASAQMHEAGKEVHA